MWLTDRPDPSVVVVQYTTDSADGVVPEGVAALVQDDFVAGVSCSRWGAADGFRTVAARWGIPFGDIEADVSLWCGDADANVPIAGVRRFESEISGVWS